MDTEAGPLSSLIVAVTNSEKYLHEAGTRNIYWFDAIQAHQYALA
jgi:hypothetical protein